MKIPTPTDFAVSHWTLDPLTLGGWSLLKPHGSPSTRQFLGTTPFTNGRILLAGEFTNPTDAGMVHGAYLEGVRAAEWCLETCHSNLRNSRDVIIIGAGAAGLGCTRTLLDRSYPGKVVVLEARDRIGGRVHTVRLEDEANAFAVELGANWLQQGKRNPLRDLANQLGLAVSETDFMAPLEYPAHKMVSPERADKIMTEFSKRSNQLVGRYRQEAIRTVAVGPGENDSLEIDESAAPGRDDASIQQVLDQWLDELRLDQSSSDFTPEEVLHVIEGELCIDTGAPLKDLSAKYGMEPGVGEGDFWVVDGYNQIIEALAKGVDVRLESEVKSIKWDQAMEKLVVEVVKCGDDTTVSGDREKCCLTSDLVICAIPAAVLQREPSRGGILFDPPMPASHMEALSLLTTGRVEKVALQFEQRWWPTNLSGGYIRAFGEKFGDVSEWLDCSDVYGVPIISGLFTGPWLEDIWCDTDGTVREDSEIAARATAALARAIAAHENDSWERALHT